MFHVVTHCNPRTATMDDIYRHIMTSPTPPNNSLISSTLLTNNKLARRQDKHDENEYEEGDVTGYAMQHPGVMVSVLLNCRIQYA